MKRDGSLIAEALVAIAVMSIVLVTVAQTASVARKHLLLARYRQAATLEAANVVERAMALPWPQLTTAGVASWKLSQATAGQLPHGKLEVSIQPLQNGPVAKKITVRVTWSEGTNGLPAQVQLVAWKTRVGEGAD